MTFFRPLITIGLALSILAAPLQQAMAQSFYDVPYRHKNETAIESLTDLGIIGGYPDGSFQPNKPISRAEAAKILMGAIKPSHLIDSTRSDLYSQSLSSPFYDVPAEEWFAPYVTLAYQNDVVQGYPDGSFKPGNTINMAEGLKIILEAYGADVSRVRFVDNPLLFVNVDEWFYKYFGYANNHNLINPEKFYHPAQWMTRGDFAEILHRVKTSRETGEETYVTPQRDFSDEYTITIPRLGIINVNVSFADPFDSKGSLTVLNDGLGHYLSPPGSGHKMVLFGHSSGYSWDKSAFKQILTKIDQVQVGDMIYINYHEKGYAYQVNQKEIRPATDMAPVMEDYGYEEMALYTCWPPNSIAKRYVLYAALI